MTPCPAPLGFCHAQFGFKGWQHLKFRKIWSIRIEVFCGFSSKNDSIGNDEEPNIFKEGCVFIRSWNHLKSVFFSQKIKDGSGFLVAERTAEFTNAPCDLVETDFGKSDWMGSPTFATLDPRMKLLWLEKNHRGHVGNVTCSGWFPVSQIIVQPIFQYEWLIWQLVQRPFLIQSVLGLLVSFPLKFTPTGTTSEPRLGCEAQVVYLYEWGKNLSLGIGIGKKRCKPSKQNWPTR